MNQCITTDSQATGPAASAPEGGTAAALPCLNTINCNEGQKEKSKNLSSGHRKTAFALKQNVLLMIGKHGLERIGFLTLTFARHVVACRDAQKALHSLMTGIINCRYPEYIIVMERMHSKRIHYHLLVIMAEDIRTGFDFAAIKRGDYRSASPYLRREWEFWRHTAPKYGFGRTELLPIRKSAAGVAKYVAKYVAKHIGQRLPEDKGARLVRYSKQANRVGTRFSWATDSAMMWRLKLGLFCQTLGLTEDNYKARLKEWFGSHWVHALQPVIVSIKPPPFYSATEATTSLGCAWVVALDERERRRQHQRPDVGAAHRHLPGDAGDSFPEKPVHQRASWLERSVKED